MLLTGHLISTTTSYLEIYLPDSLSVQHGACFKAHFIYPGGVPPTHICPKLRMRGVLLSSRNRKVVTLGHKAVLGAYLNGVLYL
jgi:hypothetical protein